MSPMLSRRNLLQAGGGIVVGLSLSGGQVVGQTTDRLPEYLANNPRLDAWLRIDANGDATLFTGKVELGQGVLTALVQIAADELDLPIERFGVVSGDTRISPDEGPTAGSLSMPESGTAIQFAAAEVRHILLDAAARRLNVPMSVLRTTDGVVTSPDGRKITYGDLAGGEVLRREATGRRAPKPAANRRHVGHAVQRIDLPAKFQGEPAFLQDERPEGLLHGRVVRPPFAGARLVGVSDSQAAGMPGVVKVVRDGSFLAVIASDERQAMLARDALERAARWEGEAPEVSHETIHEWLKSRPSDDSRIFSKTDPAPAAERVHEATYRRPFLMHGSIGPSAAIALLDAGEYVITTHSQTVFSTAPAIAQMLGVPVASVRLRHAPGSGCYGHNGADDVAADAALLARSVPGRPVRVQWERRDEHAWEPLGSAMQIELRAGVDRNGDIVDWRCDLWSMPHSTRPGGEAGNLFAAQTLAQPFAAPPARAIPAPSYGPDRNAIPAYDFSRQEVTTHLVRDTPVRVSALRSLGAHANVFAIESFIDELALAAAADPVAYRLRHLSDPRAIETIRRTAQSFGWDGFVRAPGRGRGIGFARYKNLAAYCAVCMETEFSADSGVVTIVRATVGVDAGAVVNPDGLRNQIEGGLLQSISWTLKEEVRFASGRVLSDSWAAYPILRFSEAPPVDVVVIDHPDAPFLGAGEASQGPAAAALGNAVSDALGVRVRSLPLTPDRLRAAASGAIAPRG